MYRQITVMLKFLAKLQLHVTTEVTPRKLFSRSQGRCVTEDTLNFSIAPPQECHTAMHNHIFIARFHFLKLFLSNLKNKTEQQQKLIQNKVWNIFDCYKVLRWINSDKSRPSLNHKSPTSAQNCRC